MWKRIALYATLLAAGALVLQWLDYQRLARVYPEEVYIALIALAFLAVGIAIGARVWGGGLESRNFDGNPKALAALGISPREFTVLQEIAAGHSGKEIAARLKVSPNTVKTHTSRLFEKLDVTGRVDAINKARELGLLP